MEDQPIETLEVVQKRHILATLDRLDNNIARSADALGITIKTLYTRLHRWGLFEQYRKRNSSSVRMGL